MFVLILCFVFGITSFKINLWAFLDSTNLIQGGDLSSELAIAKIAYSGNLLGFTNEIGWPEGFSIWSYPLTGIGPILTYYILGLFKTNFSIFFIYLLTSLIGNLINMISAYWMIKPQVKNNIYSYIFALVVGLSTLIYYRIGHMPVIWFYFPLIILGLWLRYVSKPVKLTKLFFIIFIAGALSPAWWVFVVIFFSFTISVILLGKFRQNRTNYIFWTTVWTVSFVSLLPTYVLYTFNKSFVGELARNQWESNTFGGRFSDLFLLSPTINSGLNLPQKLIDGVSPESSQNVIGIILAASFFVALIFALYNTLVPNPNYPGDLTLLIFIIFMYFISGGLGNLQATLFTLINEASPARAWSRLLILISILGLYIFVKYLDSKNFKIKYILMISIFFASLSILETSYSKTTDLKKIYELEEYLPVQYIQNNSDNCPILQIPLDTIPVPQDFTFQNGTDFFQNEYIPYLISPKNKWSLGGSPGSKHWKDQISLTREVNSLVASQLKEKGFCGMLFDKFFAQWQIERSAGLNRVTGENSNSGDWPGITIEGLVPSYENSRFQVYLF